MIGSYQCWWVSSLGIAFTCCTDCHKNGKYKTITTPQGTHVTVCCGALRAYLDQNGDMLADPHYHVAGNKKHKR